MPACGSLFQEFLVVDDQVQIEFLGRLFVDPSQKAEELLVPVTGLAFGDHRTGGHIQGCKQGGGAVADVVMRHTLHVAQSHGQQRLRPVQSLNLRLLVYAEHDSVLGWIEIQADDVANLLDKERIGGELERFLPVRLNREGLQPVVNGGF